MTTTKASMDKGVKLDKAASAKGSGKGKSAPPKAPPPRAKSRHSSAKPAARQPIGRSLAGVRGLPGTARASSAEAFRRKSSADSEAGPTFDPTAFDFDALHSLLTAKQPGATPDKSSKASLQQHGRPARVELLDHKVAQNVEIVLRKMKFDSVQLAEALGNLTPEACELTADEAERLVKVLPTPEQLLKLMQYKFDGNDPKNLRDTEQRLLPLAALKRLAPRLRLLVLAKTVDARVRETLHSTATLQQACHALQDSDVLRDVLQSVLVLFNYMNFGTAPGDSPSASHARIVDVHSLSRLRETRAPASKGPFPRYNMLHFCLHQLLRQRPELRREDWNQELGVLTDATSISLVQLRHGLAQLKEDQVFISSELRGHRRDYVTCWVREPGAEPEEPEEEDAPNASKAMAASDGFDQDSFQDCEDDENDVLDPAAHDQHRPSLLSRIHAKVVDTAVFLQDRWKGDAVAGLAEHTDWAPPFVADDGEAPPPGLLWRLRPSGRWRQYWCEIRSSVLVLYRIHGDMFGKANHTCLATSYMGLPCAEVLPLSSLFASESARKLANSVPNAFEVRLSGRSETEIFQAKNSNEVARWIKLLEQQAACPGIGSLSLHVGGWTPWKRMFCILERTAKSDADAGTSNGARLLGFAHSRYYVQARTPDFTLSLTNATVRFLDGDAASKQAKRLASSVRHGLEVEDYENGTLWHFECDSLIMQRMWYREMANQEVTDLRKLMTLQESFCLEDAAPDENELFDIFGDQIPEKDAPSRYSSCMTTDPGEVAQPASSGKPAPLPMLLSFTPKLEESNVEAPTSAGESANNLGTVEAGRMRSATDWLSTTSSPASLPKAAAPTSISDVALEPDGGETKEPVELDALGQLTRFDAEMAAAVDRWTCAIAATEADCRGLLKFFGLEPPSDGTGLASAAMQLLEALSSFRGQVSTAWDEIERHSDSKTSENRPSRQSRKTL